MTYTLISPSLDPHFNLAAEEYLLRQADQDVFMLWRSQPSIIVGRNQNTLAQIHVEFVMKNGLQLARRLSGGGAVFHDLGNVNFTFIATRPDGPKLDFRRYTTPILSALSELGVEADFGSRNELTIQGSKISGNSQHIHRDRVLHHGTLLYNASMEVMSQSLHVNSARYQGHAVKSVKSEVTNIADHMTSPPEVQEFIRQLMGAMRASLAEGIPYHFNDADLAEIEQLRQAKYSAWQWIFGRSPSYQFSNRLDAPAGSLDIRLMVEDGMIQAVRLTGDLFTEQVAEELAASLAGVRHDWQTVSQAVNQFATSNQLGRSSVSLLLPGFF